MKPVGIFPKHHLELEAQCIQGPSHKHPERHQRCYAEHVADSIAQPGKLCHGQAALQTQGLSTTLISVLA